MEHTDIGAFSFSSHGKLAFHGKWMMGDYSVMGF